MARQVKVFSGTYASSGNDQNFVIYTVPDGRVSKVTLSWAELQGSNVNAKFYIGDLEYLAGSSVAPHGTTSSAYASITVNYNWMGTSPFARPMHIYMVGGQSVRVTKGAGEFAQLRYNLLAVEEF